MSLRGAYRTFAVRGASHGITRVDSLQRGHGLGLHRYERVCTKNGIAPVSRKSLTPTRQISLPLAQLLPPPQPKNAPAEDHDDLCLIHLNAVICHPGPTIS